MIDGNWSKSPVASPKAYFDIVWTEYIGLYGGQGAIMPIEPRGACVDGVKEREREE